MMFHIQKSYDGVFDTDTERQRIEVAFSMAIVLLKESYEQTQKHRRRNRKMD